MAKKNRASARPTATPAQDRPATLKDMLSADVLDKLKAQANELKVEEQQRKEQQQQEADYVVRPRVSTAKEVEPETDFYEEEEEHVDESQLAFQPEYGGGFSEEDFPLLDQGEYLPSATLSESEY